MSNSLQDVGPRGDASHSSHFNSVGPTVAPASSPLGAPSSVIGFAEFGLGQPLLRALGELGHAEPTPIQRKAIGPALSGLDVLGCAQTGTGKTAAFTLPLLQRLCTESGSTPSNGRSSIRALVLAPTRELAAQIDESLSLYGQFCRFRHAKVFGGVGLEGQVRTLRRGVDVLVATPGRLEDLMKSGVVELSSVEMLVLDEVDRMLDQGFLPAVTRITNKTPRNRQTLLFSATLPGPLRELARTLMRNPVEVAADVVASTPATIEQSVFHVPAQYKRTVLEHLVIEHRMPRALVFTRTKHGADRVARHLKAAGIGAEALHGGKTQSVRERALAAFRDGAVQVLVATDLAARGIHVDGISHVVNFDLPLDAENYVHRIGRTARAGECGVAFSLCSPEERDVLRRVEKLIRQRLTTATLPDLFARGTDSNSARKQSASGTTPSSSQRPEERDTDGTARQRSGAARPRNERDSARDGNYPSMRGGAKGARGDRATASGERPAASQLGRIVQPVADRNAGNGRDRSGGGKVPSSSRFPAPYRSAQSGLRAPNDSGGGSGGGKASVDSSRFPTPYRSTPSADRACSKGGPRSGRGTHHTNDSFGRRY